MTIAASAPPPRYDGVTITLHWVVAIGVLFQWGGAHAIDLFPRGAPRVDARSVHILVGLSLLLLTIWRIGWRARRGATFQPDRRRGLAIAAQMGHFALYAVLLATFALGAFDAWVRGDSIMGLFQIPRWGDLAPTARHALANQVVRLHELAANLLLILAAGHAAVAFAHHFWLRDGVLARMITFVRPRWMTP